MDPIKELKTQLRDLSTQAAAEFLKNQSNAVTVLGQNRVKAFLDAAFHEQFPLPVVPPNATAEQLAEIQEALSLRRTSLDLVAEAERTDSDLSLKVKADAKELAKKVSGAAIGILFSVGLKALLGG